MSCTEEKTCDLVATFRRHPVIRRAGNCAPSLRPGVTLRGKVRGYEIRSALNVEPLLIERAQLR